MNIIPPYDTGNEQAVLGSMIEDCKCISKIEFLTREDFYLNQHKMIFDLIMDKYNKHGTVDLSILYDSFTDELGGSAYAVDLVKSNASSRNVVAYAKIVLEQSIKRKAIAEYMNSIEELQDANSDMVKSISRASQSVDKELCRMSTGDVLTVDDLIGHSINKMEESGQNPRVGISTGIQEIDERLGYQKLAIGEITALGAMSKNGKTLTANTIVARSELLDDEVAHVFSIEMPAVGMFNGIVSAISGVPSNFYARQDYYHKNYYKQFDEWFGRWSKAASDLKETGKITIDGRKDVTMQYICAEMRKRSAIAQSNGKKLKLVIIDHMHRISFDTKEKAMTYVMGDDVRMLKNTAADLGIAVLLLTQLNEAHKDSNPTAYHILDTSRVRQEIQCFIGLRIFRESSGTYFGVYSDAHRYGDHETNYSPGYMKLVGGVLKSLPDNEKNWRPSENSSD